MKMNTVNAALVVVSLLAVSSLSGAALIHHWTLDETSLTWEGGVWNGVQNSVAGNPVGALWGYAETSDLSGVVGQPGVPLYSGDNSFNFIEPSGISGVNTGVMTAIPATGDFTLLVWMKTTAHATGQGHLFSNNNNQSGRANLAVLDGKLFWFVNGGLNAASNVAIDSGATKVNDGQWYQAGVARQGDRFDLLLNGDVVASGNSTAQISENQLWMIGRMRAFSGDFDGSIADVKIYDQYIPEPATLLLLGLGAAVLRRSRKA